MTSATQNTTIHSSMADDPDFGELVDMYVDEMPDRITALEEAFDSGDMEVLRRAAHQMKGAAGSYGFDQLTPYAAAAAVEAQAHDGEPEENIQKTVQELLDICRLVRAGTPS
jgi:HPt (histidine-containing phosphotransfer) domain-containing protein